MAIVTSTSASVVWDGKAIAKLRDVSIDAQRDALESTALGDSSRNYIYGLKGATGQGTLMYDNTDTNIKALLEELFGNATAGKSLALTLSAGKTISGTALITSVGTSVSVGEITSCAVQFQFTGSVAAVF